jgi:prepilin-type N-terminal cleavage/methylation domain-containing protein
MRRSRQNRPAFTLIELMVVAAIIVILLTITIPAIKSLMDSSQAAQSENVIRAQLIAVRTYAMSEQAIAGLRFQEDGRIVQVYAANGGSLYSPDNFRQTPIYQMKAVSQVKPESLSGNFRVISMDAFTAQMPRTTNNWWTNERWYATTMVLFSPDGRAIQAKCVFPPNWYPLSSGAFGRYIYDNGQGPIFAYQGMCGVGRNSAGGISGVTRCTGPSLTTDFRLYDSTEVTGLIKQAHEIPSVEDGYDLYDYSEEIEAATNIMTSSGGDFLVDVNTGMMIRKGADLGTQQ